MISLITPTRLEKNRLTWLEQLSKSLSTNVDIEHIIVVDGGKIVPEELNLHTSLVIHTGKEIGTGAARNYGLLKASGKYIGSVDDDDLVNPQGMSFLADRLDEDSSLSWVSGYLQDMHEDGSLMSTWKHNTPPGYVKQGEVFSHWEAPHKVFPIAPTGIISRKEALLSIGGWGALPQAEDFLMVMNLTGKYPGLSTEEIVYYYRKHPYQMTKERGFEVAEKKCRQFCYQTGKWNDLRLQ